MGFLLSGRREQVASLKAGNAESMRSHADPKAAVLSFPNLRGTESAFETGEKSFTYSVASKGRKVRV